MWENRTYPEELQASMYVEPARLPEFGDAIRKQTRPTDPSYPYPVFEITRNINLHVVPLARKHELWAVEKQTDEVLAQYSDREFFWYDSEQQADAITVLRAGVPGTKQGSGFTDGLRDALGTELTRDFDDELARKLLLPVVRLLKRWTDTVEAEKVTYPGRSTVRRTEWTIRLVGDETISRDWESTYTTAQLCQQSPEKLQVDIRRWFPDNVYLTSTGWFDLSRFWIERASVNGFAECDLAVLEEEVSGLQRGETGTFHLCIEDRQPACHITRCSGERAPFDLDNLPVAARLCSHCHRHVKERLVAQKLLSALESI